MKRQLADFRFRTWHFIILFFLLMLIINVMGREDLDIAPDMPDSSLIELDAHSIADSISDGICYVLFYTENSAFCNKMEYNISQMKDAADKARFFKVNVDENIDNVIKQNISGVPTVLIYKDGKEIERVMGLVPVSNLKLISKKIGG